MVRGIVGGGGGLSCSSDMFFAVVYWPKSFPIL